MKLRIGTRGSPLALAQAREVQAAMAIALGIDASEIEISVISTTGDRIRDRPLAEIGGKGLFTKELEEGLHAGTIDIAVHSMKDMPAAMPPGLAIGAVLPREDPRDAFISVRYSAFAELPENAILGSSSVRRTAQALRRRPDLKPVQFRGNVETRLRKLQDGAADATFLACAGLNRLGLADRISAIMPVDTMLPAVAQGAIAIQFAQRHERMAETLSRINHGPSATAVACERAFMQALDGSCRTPIAGHAVLVGDRLRFEGEALTLDGAHCFAAAREGPAADGERMGRDAAAEVLAQGGRLIVST